jgi:hypothetical protein
MKPGYRTTEFATVVASLIVTTLILLGVIRPGEEAALREVLVDVVMALGSLAANAAILVEYIRSRTTLKQNGSA